MNRPERRNQGTRRPRGRWWSRAGLLLTMSLLLVGPGRGQSPAPVSSAPAGPAATMIELTGALTATSARQVIDQLTAAAAAGAPVIVLRLDVETGSAAEAMRIARLIKTDLAEATVVAWVRDRAAGPGAVIALACDRVFCHPRATLGGGRFIDQPDREADVTAWRASLRAQMRDSAALNDLPAALAEAMVDPSLEVWRIVDPSAGMEQRVRRDQWQGRVRVAPGVSDAPSNDDASWRLEQVINPAGQPLVLTATEAAGLDLATIAETSEAVAAAVGVDRIDRQPGPGDAPRPAQAGDLPAPPKRSQSLPELPEPVERAFIIPIEGPITPVTADSLSRKVVRIRAAGAELVVFEIDTPGGAVAALLEMTDMINTDLAEVRTVAWVNNEATSAGALLALSCDEIIMAPSSTMGASAVVSGGGAEIGETMEAKIDSFLRGKIRNWCQAHGYHAALAEAMLDVEMGVWLIENIVTGERRIVDADAGDPPLRNPPTTQAVAQPQADWRVVRVLVGEGQLLTMTTAEAAELGFSAGVVADRAALRQRYNITAEPTVLEDNWSEKLTDFMTSPLVTGLLIMGLLFFAYVEVNTPGLGVPGALALVCLIVLIGSRFLVNLALWWEIALLVVGLVLLGVELFVIPGFGVAGISGLICIFAGLAAMLAANAPDEMPWELGGVVLERFLDGVFFALAGLVGAVVLSMIAARYLPKVPLANRLVLAAPKVGPTEPSTEDSEIRRINPGDLGEVIAHCRPVGRAKFGQLITDVMADGEFLPPGTRVQVLRREGNRLIVIRKEARA